MPESFYVPEKITVHLGPPDSPALNVTLYFADYVKKRRVGRDMPALAGECNPRGRLHAADLRIEPRL